MITVVSFRFWLFLEVFFRPDLVEQLPSLFGPQDFKDQKKADQLSMNKYLRKTLGILLTRAPVISILFRCISKPQQFLFSSKGSLTLGPQILSVLPGVSTTFKTGGLYIRGSIQNTITWAFFFCYFHCNCKQTFLWNHNSSRCCRRSVLTNDIAILIIVITGHLCCLCRSWKSENAIIRKLAMSYGRHYDHRKRKWSSLMMMHFSSFSVEWLKHYVKFSSIFLVFVCVYSLRCRLISNPS